MVCGHCERFGLYTSGFCLACLRRYLKYRLDPEDAMLANAVFHYDEPVRDIVLRAKIHHDRACIAFLQQCFVHSPLTRSIVAQCDVVIPAASSLWSRFYGRFDLAFQLAWAVNKEFHLRLCRPPSKLGWRWRKQAHRRMRQRVTKRGLVTLPGARILLIDDIRTSGQTLKQLSECFDAAQVRTLTLVRNRPKT